MRHRSKTRRRNTKSDEFELMCETGDALRARFSTIRCTEVIEYKDGQWTVCAQSERLVDDQWIEIDFTDLDSIHLSRHRKPIATCSQVFRPSSQG